MRRILCALALLLCVRNGLAADAAPSSRLPPEAGPWVVRAYFDDKAQLATVTRRTEPWEVRHDQRYAVVEVPNRYEYSLLLASGMRVAIDEELTALLRTPPSEMDSIPSFACYRTVEETYASIDQLVAAHPTLASSIDIGDSWEKARNPALGYDLRVLRLTNSAIPGPKPRAFVIGAIHAREYTTAETVMRFAEDLLARYANDADARWMLDHFELHVLPQANPDGRKKAELGQSWRKNVNENYCGATSSSRGADLNRNFPFEWGAHGGSSPAPCDPTFRGAAPASEPETAAIIGHLQALFPDQRPPDLVTPAPTDLSGVFMDVHSYGELVLWPWSFGTAAAPNGNALAAFGRRLAAINGHRPQQGIELYVTDGGTKDFTYGELGVPALSFELGSSFFESCADFEAHVLGRNVAALNYLLRVARRPYLEPSGPSIENLLTAPVEAGETIRLVGSANDSAFNQSNGVEPVQPVTGVDAFVDRVPWSGPPAPDAAAVAADGSFDAPTELFVADLASTGLANGRHAIHLRARDSGATGPTWARYVDVVAPGSTARLSGTIRNANSGAPLAVPASLRLGSYGTLALPATGATYALRAPIGIYDLAVSAPGYAAATVSGINLASASGYTRDLALLPICTLLADSASNGLGNFNAQPPWGIGTLRYFSAPAAFTDSPGGNYAASVNTSLTMAPIDLSAVSSVRLKFQSYCDTEAGYDRGRVEISTNGSNWSELWQCSGSSTWTAVDLDLSALNGVATAFIRFRFTSDTSVQLDGWSVDDIVLEGAGAICGGGPETVFANGFE